MGGLYFAIYKTFLLNQIINILFNIFVKSNVGGDIVGVEVGGAANCAAGVVQGPNAHFEPCFVEAFGNVFCKEKIVAAQAHTSVDDELHTLVIRQSFFVHQQSDNPFEREQLQFNFAVF